MTDKKYKLKFLPLFEQDLNDTVDYISLKLKNPKAARDFVNEVQAAIRKRQACPKSFEPYHSEKERRYKKRTGKENLMANLFNIA